jgi:hypothetical protein
LWNENVFVRALYEVATSHIGHDLGARQDLDMEFLFELTTLLR